LSVSAVSRLTGLPSPVHGFDRNVSAETPIAEFDRGQAGAVNRDAVAELDSRKVQLAAIDGKPDIAAANFALPDASQSLDNPGKH
jgi:hypothetical protein